MPDPREAIAILEKDRSVDLVITDYAMPGMTGMELAAVIRSIIPDMPIILASGYAELPHGADEGLEVSRLSKPYRMEELANAVANSPMALSKDTAVSKA